MRERLAVLFLPVLAAALPLAGLVLTIQQWIEGSRREALRLALATVAGLLLWTVVLTA